LVAESVGNGALNTCTHRSPSSSLSSALKIARTSSRVLLGREEEEEEEEEDKEEDIETNTKEKDRTKTTKRDEMDTEG